MSAQTTARPGAREVSLGSIGDLRARGRAVVEIDGVGIGVFAIGDEVRAYLNICPHMGGPACQGKIMPRTLEVVSDTKQSLGLAFSKDDLHIVCPWHGYEFDMRTGAHPANPRIRLRPVPVRVVAGEVRVSVGGT